MHWINILRVDPDNRLIHRLLTHVLWVSPNQLKALSVGTFVFAGLYLTEGTGLLLRKRWAEYFTIITTAGLIPLEIYEMARHLTAAKVAVLAVNVAIVVYLVVRVRRGRSGEMREVTQRPGTRRADEADRRRGRSRPSDWRPDERCSTSYPTRSFPLAARPESFAAVGIPDPHDAILCAEVIAEDRRTRMRPAS